VLIVVDLCSHLPPAGVAGYDEGFVRKMEEEMQSLRRKLHDEQEARTQTGNQLSLGTFHEERNAGM